MRVATKTTTTTITKAVITTITGSKNKSKIHNNDNNKNNNKHNGSNSSQIKKTNSNEQSKNKNSCCWRIQKLLCPKRTLATQVTVSCQLTKRKYDDFGRWGRFHEKQSLVWPGFRLDKNSYGFCGPLALSSYVLASNIRGVMVVVVIVVIAVELLLRQ